MEYIGIEVFNHLNDNYYKVIIINRLLLKELADIVKTFLFMTSEERIVRNMKQTICNTFKYAYVFTRRIDDNSSSWAFLEKYPRSQFQARMCKFCGNYTDTRSIVTDHLCANNVKCNCIVTHLFGNMYFNWTYNGIIYSSF